VDRLPCHKRAHESFGRLEPHRFLATSRAAVPHVQVPVASTAPIDPPPAGTCSRPSQVSGSKKEPTRVGCRRSSTAHFMMHALVVQVVARAFFAGLAPRVGQKNESIGSLPPCRVKHGQGKRYRPFRTVRCLRPGRNGRHSPRSTAAVAACRRRARHPSKRFAAAAGSPAFLPFLRPWHGRGRTVGDTGCCWKPLLVLRRRGVTRFVSRFIIIVREHVPTQFVHISR
jgi:hypothetical protein